MAEVDNPAFFPGVDKHHDNMWTPLFTSGQIGSDKTALVDRMKTLGVYTQAESVAVEALGRSLDADSDDDIDPAPDTATAATGVFGPSGSGIPYSLAVLNSGKPRPVPATTWTTGQHVVLGNASKAYWLAAALPATTGTASTDVFASTAHGLVAGAMVIFTALTGGAGLATNTKYVVATVPNANSFTLNTAAGAAVDFTTDLTVATVYKGAYAVGEAP